MKKLALLALLLFGCTAHKVTDPASKPRPRRTTVSTDSGAVQLCFFLSQSVVVLLVPVDLGQQLSRPSFLGPELQDVLQGFPCMRVGVVFDVLGCQFVPALNLALAAPAFDPAF